MATDPHHLGRGELRRHTAGRGDDPRGSTAGAAYLLMGQDLQ